MSNTHSPLRQDPNLDDGGLATLEKDGSRRWLYPKLSGGRFLVWRRVVAWILIAVYALVPYIPIGGRPMILLDLVHREFTILGHTFLPTDTLLLAFLVLAAFIGVFLTTALFGRLWCGWACPQTVWLEFLYRPIERLFDGTAGRGGKPVKPVAVWRTPAKYLVFLILSMFITHTFLAYFVGVDALLSWVTGSPFAHPVAFMVMAVSTVLWMLNFCYFREQTCLVACPYGRFQSALLDRQSLIITYDAGRGEPRGKLIREPTPLSPLRGDCVDCGLCVKTCPTGIDIRRGLQMECIACAQCIDACDAVMAKIHKPAGLIRYSSQAAIDGEKPRLLRVRTILYPLLLIVFVGAFVVTFLGKSSADLNLLRNPGSPYVTLRDGTIGNGFRLKIHNRAAEPQGFAVSLPALPDAVIESDALPATLEAGETRVLAFIVSLPPAAFARGPVTGDLVVAFSGGEREHLRCRLLGPIHASTPATTTTHPETADE